MKITISRKHVLPWVLGIALAALVGALAAAIRLIWMNWALFRPSDATSAWAAVEAIAASISAAFAIAVAAIGLRALRSLKLTRTEMLNRTEREGKLSALLRLEELAREVIPMNGPILDVMAEHRIKVFVASAAEVRFDPDPSNLKEALAWAQGLPPGTSAKIKAFLNRLEAWSAYFTNGLATEAVAFGPVAPLLRSWVGQYYPILLLERAQRRSGNFPNLVMLYTVWSNKMDEQQLATLHKDLVAQLERQRSNMSKAQLPDVIGTKIDR